MFHILLKLAGLLLAVLVAGVLARTDVAIISTGRAGSTLLMNALASVPESIHMFEPHFAYQVFDDNNMLVQDDGLPLHVPRLKEFFDCSVFNDPDAAAMSMSQFSCKSSHWIAETPDEVDACLRSMINIARTKERCNNAHMMILKIIRLPWLAHKLGTSALFPPGAKVIHLVRHPAAVLKSQFAAGWDELLEARGDGQAHAPKIIRLVDEICYEMTVNTAIIKEYEASTQQGHVLVVRYEDLAHDFHGVMQQILQFVGAESTDELTETLEAVRQIKHANIPTLAVKSITDEQAAVLVSADPFCRQVIGQYYRQRSDL